MKSRLFTLCVFITFIQISFSQEMFDCKEKWKLIKMEKFLKELKDDSFLGDTVDLKLIGWKLLNGNIKCPIVDTTVFRINLIKINVWHLNGSHNPYFFYYESYKSFFIISEEFDTNKILSEIRTFAKLDGKALKRREFRALKKAISRFTSANNHNSNPFKYK